MNVLVYDLEIIKAIRMQGAKPVRGIKYCAGWHDHAEMGISVIGAMDLHESTWVFREDRHECYDSIIEFQKAVDRSDLLVGFNSLQFDDCVCAANGIFCKTGYDILREFYAAKGLNPFPEIYDDRYRGYRLDALAYATLGERKTGNGTNAPIMWQRGEKTAVIQYCLDDVRLTKRLFDRIRAGQPLIDPMTEEAIVLRNPL